MPSEKPRDNCYRLIALRRNHPAWLLLASRNGPLALASLQSLTDAQPEGVPFEDAVEHLASLFRDFANDTEFDTGENHSLAARRELRQWLKRGLIVERDGQVLATDALQKSLQFLESLEDQTMTSTASRLATVQRAIENLEVQLNRDQTNREHSLKKRIAALEQELASVQQGDFVVLSGPQAEEGIREVYQLAVSLLADFRRVEDSFRTADRELRQRIITEKHHRGKIVDELLDGHEALVETAEGKVFAGFHLQLVQSAELEQMKQRIRSILNSDDTDRALQRKQKSDMRLLVTRLVQESERVIKARAKSERDVRSFLKSGLADEQIRIGAILQELFQVAYDVDWQSQKVRRTPGPLPPIGIATPNLPLAQRFLVKDAGVDEATELDFSTSEVDPSEMGAEFWDAYRALDRENLFESTIAQLQATGKSLTIGQLAVAIPPTHDLETLVYWLAMAREAGIEIEGEIENIDLFDEADGGTQFLVPHVELNYPDMKTLSSENLE